MFREYVTTRLNVRWKLFSTRIHIASFLLDPRFRKNSSSTDDELCEKQFREVQDFICEFATQIEWDTSVYLSWIAFRNNLGLFLQVVFLFVPKLTLLGM
jgi:hypothetical protein